MLFLDSDSFNDDYEVCLNAWNGLKPFRTSSDTAAVVSLEWVSILMFHLLQVMYEYWDSSHMIFGWCLKWKIGECTSGLWDGLLRLKICTYGGWWVILSFGCFCDVWMVQTTSIWCLVSVRIIGLIRTCKVWKLQFYLLWNYETCNSRKKRENKCVEMFWCDFELRNDLYL